MTPTLTGIEEAARLLAPHLLTTPLIRSELLSATLEADVWIKNETVSPIASFKLRGAITALARALASGSVAGCVTSSTGNHGQGIAYAARLFGVLAHVFVPSNPNPAKRAMLAALGAVVHEQGADLDEAKAAARAYADAGQLLFVDDGESCDVIEGAGTIGLEVVNALPHCEVCWLPMGSGSLAAGCAIALKALGSRARIWAVQSESAPAMVKSYQARRAIVHPSNTIADGLDCREPAALALRCMLDWVDGAVAVPDRDLLAATRMLIEDAHILAEPSGAAGLAGAYRSRSLIAGKTAVLVVTGANITTELLCRALAGERWAREKGSHGAH